MTILRFVARPMMASIFFAGASSALKNANAVGAKAQPVANIASQALGQEIPAETLVRVNAATQIVAAASLATGRFPRLSAAILAGSLVPTTAVGHQFWNEADPMSKRNQMLHFFKNASIIGGLLMSTLDPDPHKKAIGTRAKDKVSQVLDR